MTDTIKWLIGLLGFGVLCLVCLNLRACDSSAQVPSGVQANAQGALSALGLGAAAQGLELKMEGQEVVLEGELIGTEADKQRVVDAVMAAEGVTDVRADALTVESPAPPPPPPAEPRYYDVVGTKSAEGAVRLTGEVPDEETRAYLVSMAGERFGADNVTDELRIVADDGPAIGNFRMVLEKGTTGLGTLMQGRFAITQGALAINGEVHESDEATVRALGDAMPDEYRSEDFALLVAEQADACDERFSALLARSQVRFRVSSAVISPASRRLLTQLADVAKECPGAIKVEGHTDSRGGHDLNVELSQQRADAVRVALTEQGVEGERIRTEGFGPDRPIGNNRTNAGRAKNRRIEMRIERN